MGLKFGVWVGRGITQTALTANTPIYGTDNKIFAKDIYSSSTKCPWDANLFSVNASKNGSQQFINSLYSQFASWGVDFIKNDCIFGPNYYPDQINLVSNAMDNVRKTMNGYEFTYSLSPGNQGIPPEKLANVSSATSEVNMYRITGDTWDQWTNNILQHFNVTAEWAKANFIGNKGRDDGTSYPDLDMLPLGLITDSRGSRCEPYRKSGLTQSEQRVLITLWSMCRSPLIFGGQVMALQNDTFTKGILTNKYALDVNFNSSMNQQVRGNYDSKGNPVEIIWAADGVNNDYYVALFSVNTKAVDISITFKEIGGNIAKYNKCDYVESWSAKTGTMENGVVEGNVNANDTLLYYLHSCT